MTSWSVPLAWGEGDSISCRLGTDVVFVDQIDLDAEQTNFEDFIRLTSCETIDEPDSPDRRHGT